MTVSDDDRNELQKTPSDFEDGINKHKNFVNINYTVESVSCNTVDILNNHIKP